MGTLTDLNSQIPVSRLPPETTLDSELLVALTGHLSATDPHTQYLLESLPLLLKNAAETPFNANDWQPNLNQSHRSAINIAWIGNNVANTNLPSNALFGTIVELDPFLDSNPNRYKAQLFWTTATGAFSFRTQNNGSWNPWRQIATTNGGDVFSEVSRFQKGLLIGASTTTILKKIISQVFTIDPPNIPAGGVHGLSLNLPGAAVGDSVFVSPIGADIWNTAQWPFEFPATVAASNTIQLIVRNDWLAPLDLTAFQIRVIVFEF